MRLFPSLYFVSFCFSFFEFLLFEFYANNEMNFVPSKTHWREAHTHKDYKTATRHSRNSSKEDVKKALFLLLLNLVFFVRRRMMCSNNHLHHMTHETILNTRRSHNPAVADSCVVTRASLRRMSLVFASVNRSESHRAVGMCVRTAGLLAHQYQGTWRKNKWMTESVR